MCDQLSFTHFKLIRIRGDMLIIYLKKGNNGWNGVSENAIICIKKDVRNIFGGWNYDN